LLDPETSLVTEGYAPYRGFRTWFRITGNLNSASAPLVLIHGGPGLTHDYLNAYVQLTATGRAIVQYDQIGNGRSTHFSAVTDDAPSVSFYAGELAALLQHLGIANRFALLAHSCGVCIATEFALRDEPGLKALVLANGFAATALFQTSLRQRRNELLLPLQTLLNEHESQGILDAPAYQSAVGEFLQRFVCRVPFPPELQHSHMAMLSNPLVFQTMYGPSLFQPTGRLRGWSITERLHLIKAPTLVLRGAFDEANETSIQPFIDKIPNVQRHVLEHSSHMPHIEQTDECVTVVRAFLDSASEQ
jgi:L-proline amide hydrolase